MTLILDLDLDVLKTHGGPKMKLLSSGFQKLDSEQYGHTDTHMHTDKRDRTHYHAAFAGVNNGVIWQLL